MVKAGLAAAGRRGDGWRPAVRTVYNTLSGSGRAITQMKGLAMRAVVDPDTCIGCEACVGICPELFQMQGPVAVAILDPVPDEHHAAAREAAEICPTAAIAIQE